MERLEGTSQSSVASGSSNHGKIPMPESIANVLQLEHTPHDRTDPQTNPLHLISTLQTLQNERDAHRDAADLRQLMRSALQTNDDLEMIKVLQVGRDEMPEAIKTLQRALEIVLEKERVEEACTKKCSRVTLRVRRDGPGELIGARHNEEVWRKFRL